MEYQRVLVVGDVHGCVDEMDDLLKAADYKQGRDRLILAGDLIDRGPDSPGVVRRAQEVGAEAVLGNHDEKVRRWVKHEERYAATGKPNPMQVHGERLAEWKRFRPQDLKYLSELPAYLRINQSWLVVHAGFEIDKPIEEQKLGDICRVQYLDNDTGRYASAGHPWVQPPNSSRWTEVWNRPENVIYGHVVYSLKNVQVDQPGTGGACYGIDTGAVFGGALSGLILDGDKVEFVQVQARRQYHSSKGRGEDV